jgi:hypothetical protein
METRTRYIYRITNLINKKTYIGQHTVREGRTITSDTYWGSGNLIKAARKKYGKENFKKEILISGEFTKDEINTLEIEYISKERSIGKAEYNISDGGESPFINAEFAKYAASKTDYSKVSKSLKDFHKNNEEFVKERAQKIVNIKKSKGYSFKTKGTTGYKFSEDSKKKMSENKKGELNGSYGTHWFTNGEINVKAKECPPGFRKGRI